MSSVRIFFPKLEREEVVARLRERLPLLAQHLDLALVILFGSYAHGNYTVASDVDLLVVYRGPGRPDAFGLVKRILALPRLEPHIYSEAEYGALKPTLMGMTRGGLVLWGDRV